MSHPPRRPCLCGLCLPTWFSRGWTCPGTQEQLNRRSSSVYPYERVVAWHFYQLGHTRLQTWTMDDATCGLLGRTIEGHVIQAGKLKVIRVGSDHCGECGDPLPPGFDFCTCTKCYAVGVLQFGQALDRCVPAAVSTRILDHVDRGVSIDYEGLRTRWDKRYMKVAVVARPRPWPGTWRYSYMHESIGLGRWSSGCLHY